MKTEAKGLVIVIAAILAAYITVFVYLNVITTTLGQPCTSDCDCAKNQACIGGKCVQSATRNCQGGF